MVRDHNADQHCPNFSRRGWTPHDRQFLIRCDYIQRQARHRISALPKTPRQEIRLDYEPLRLNVGERDFASLSARLRPSLDKIDGLGEPPGPFVVRGSVCRCGVPQSHSRYERTVTRPFGLMVRSLTTWQSPTSA